MQSRLCQCKNQAVEKLSSQHFPTGCSTFQNSTAQSSRSRVSVQRAVLLNINMIVLAGYMRPVLENVGEREMRSFVIRRRQNAEGVSASLVQVAFGYSTMTKYGYSTKIAR